MAEAPQADLVTQEWVFKTADGPVDHLPVPEQFRGIVPQAITKAAIKQVQQEANETYQIVEHRGVKYETVLFNPDGDPGKTIDFTPTSASGARRNPGNMYEKAIDAVLQGKRIPIRYFTPWYNDPTGAMRPADYQYVRKTGRFTKGTGADDDELRPLDSAKDIADLYDKMGWNLPVFFSSDAEGGRQALGKMAAFGTSQGALFNGLPGIVKVKGYHKLNIMADIADRVASLGGSDAELKVNGATRRLTKKNMKAVYPWNKYFAHMAPVPAVFHPADWLKIGKLNRAYGRHNNPNKLADHAVHWDLLAAMAINDAPVTITYGTENPLGPANEIKTFFDGFVHDFPNDLRSARRTVTLKMIQDAGIDNQTSQPTGRTAIERRSFGLGAMLGLVGDDGEIDRAAG